MDWLSFGGSVGGSILGTLANMWSTNKTNKNNIQMQREANETNLTAVRETNQANMDLAEFQYLKNLEQWQRENEYNSPAKQMERLAAAGLNPNLVYQSIGNQAGSSPSYSAPELKAGQVQAPSIQRYQDFGDFGVSNSLRVLNESRMTGAQVNNLEEQNTLLKIDARAKAQEMIMQQMKIAGQAIENSKSELQYKLAKDTYKISYDIMEQNLRKLQKDINKTDTETTNIQANTALTQSNIVLNAIRGRLTEAQISKISAELPLITAQIANVQANTRNTLSEVESKEYRNLEYIRYGLTPSDPLWARSLVAAMEYAGVDKDIIRAAISGTTAVGGIGEFAADMFKSFVPKPKIVLPRAGSGGNYGRR